MDREELESFKRSELFTVAKKYNIKGLSLLTKNKIIEKILKVQGVGEKVPRKKSSLKEGPKHIHEETSRGEETKFYYPKAVHQEFPKEEYQLPSGYGDNCLVLMVRDPWWLYAYWEINPNKNQEVRAQMRGLAEGAALILRIHDVTDLDFNGSNAWRSFDIKITGGANNWYINVGQGNRAYVADLGYLAKNGHFYLIARSNCVRTPREGISDVIDEEWMTVDYARIYALSGGFGRGIGSEALKEMMERRLKEELASGRLASWGERIEKERSFWLVADAELIVYGATDPNAKVKVQGKPINLRQDGTFTLRYSLPDGRQEIPIAATSPDGIETKTITPIVERQTR